MSDGKSYFTKTDSLCFKGIAIIIMMFHHCFKSLSRFKGYEVDFSPFGQDFVVDMSDYFKICVSIFAFITGYGLYLSAKNKCKNSISTEKWTISRLVKTMSGFWFVYAIVFIVTLIYDRLPQSVYCGKGYTRGIVYGLIDFLGLANLFGTASLMGVWWYMSAAIVFIVIIPIAIKWIDKFGYFILIVFIIAVPRLIGTGYQGGVSAYSFILPVIAGMLFAQYDVFKKLDELKITKSKVFSEAFQFVVYTGLLVASIVIWMKIPQDKAWEFHYAVAPVISICFCKKYIIRIPVIKQLLSFFGKHSMNIFLVHDFIRDVYFKDFIYGFEKFWLIAFVLFVISLVISIVIEFVKKVIRYDKFISKVSDKLCLVIDKF